MGSIKVKELKISKHLSRYYIPKYNIYLDFDGLHKIAGALNLEIDIIEVTEHQGYYQKELKKAVVLKNKYDITQ